MTTHLEAFAENAARIVKTKEEIKEAAKQLADASDEFNKEYWRGKELFLLKELEYLYRHRNGVILGMHGAAPEVSLTATHMMEALRGLPAVPGPGDVLALPRGASFQLHPVIPACRSFYVRECYPRLFEAVMGSYARRRIITGTPGIGKSWFLFYFLARLLASPSPPPVIVWEHKSLPDVTWCYTHATGEVQAGSQWDFEEELDDPAAWYLAAGVQPRHGVLANLLFICPPEWEAMKAVRKKPSHLLYMPPWSLEELLACRSVLYDRVPADRVEELFNYYGGVARYVLQHPSELPACGLEVLLQPLRYALAGCGTAQVQAAIGWTGSDVAHSLLHIVPDAKFGRQRYAFASAWAAGEFAKEALKADPQGGSFVVAPVSQDLERGSEEQLQLGTCEGDTALVKAFQDVDGRSPELTYFRPSAAAGVHAVDSFRRGKGTADFFRLTAGGSSEQVDSAGLSDTLDQARLPPGLTPRLFYVVPPNEYAGFTLTPGKQRPPGQGQQGVARRVKLYIMKGTAPRPQVRTRSSGAGRRLLL